jgi:formylglycine-generating enzyme
MHRTGKSTAVLVLASAVALFVSSAGVAQDPGTGRKLAFLVGVGKYQHGKLNDLDFTENDVEDVDSALRAQGYKTLLLTTRIGKTNAARQPTQENFWSSLSAFIKQNKPTKADLMIVCLAGHGIQPLGSDDSYFCPADANPAIKEVKTPQGTKNVPANPETLVSVGDVLKVLDDSGVGYKLLLVDACRNDPSVRGRRGLDHVNVAALPEQTGVLLSCKSGEFSFEHKSLGRGHGVFFHHVIEGLSGAAQDAKGRVTWDGLGLYVRSEVPAKVRDIFGDQGGAQNPNAINNIAGEPAVLARITAPQNPTPTPTPVPKQMPAPSTAAAPSTPLIPRVVTNRAGTNEQRPASLSAPFNQGEAQAARKAWAKFYRSPEEGKNSIGMEFALIPPGRFPMGSAEAAEEILKSFPYAEKEWLAGERPVHPVTIGQPYYLAKFEVTKAQFKQFVDDANYVTDAEKAGKGDAGSTWRDSGFNQSDDSPVVNVSHNDAVAFCGWLARKEKGSYRLPTEADWEYACRAGAVTRYPNGDDSEDLTKIANVADATAKAQFPEWKSVDSSDGFVFTSPVGKFPANAFGLHDMIGNVWEWCADRYSGDYYTPSPQRDPKGPSSGSDRVYRGGAFNTDPVLCRAATRDANLPAFRNRNLGFRVVRGPAE